MGKDISEKFAKLALKMMLYEVCSAPKPGLVDGSNQGAHKDMDIFTFIDSSIAIYPTMYDCVKTGLEFSHECPGAVFSRIRKIGAGGEKEMFKSTHGINTQKGIIFLLGIICASYGMIMGQEEKVDLQHIIDKIKTMTMGIVMKELHILKDVSQKQKRKLSAGEQLYLKYGTAGIRGEVENGFPTVIEYGLPVLKDNIGNNKSLNESLINTLLSIMSAAEDTNVLWRSGMEGLKYMRNYARTVIDAGGMSTDNGREMIYKMDKDFIVKNISPGGCADLLTVTLILNEIG